MQIELRDAKPEDRLALLDIVFIPANAQKLDLEPEDTSKTFLERIGDSYPFKQIEVDDMLYGFIAVIDGDSIIVAKLPEFKDSFPLIASFNQVIKSTVINTKKGASLFFKNQEALMATAIPHFKEHGQRRWFHNPLIEPVPSTWDPLANCRGLKSPLLLYSDI